MNAREAQALSCDTPESLLLQLESVSATLMGEAVWKNQFGPDEPEIASFAAPGLRPKTKVDNRYTLHGYLFQWDLEYAGKK